MVLIHRSLYRTLSLTARAVGLSAILAVALDAPQTAQAQSSPASLEPATPSMLLNQSAVFNGYSAGYQAGTGDTGTGTRFAPTQGDTFREATFGYMAEMGPLVRYQSDFRHAFEQGYSDAYYGRDRNLSLAIPPTSRYLQPEHVDASLLRERTVSANGDSFNVASTNGYNAGYTQGVADKKRGANYEFDHQEIYSSAVQGYDESIGSRVQYQSAFRQVYARGYSDGFNDRPHISKDERLFGYDHQKKSALLVLNQSDVIRLAAAFGYHDGFERGGIIGRAQGPPSYRYDETYMNGTSGYDESWNVLSLYQDKFRLGYARGFNDGYHVRSRNGAFEADYNRYRDNVYDFRDDSIGVRDEGVADDDANVPTRRSAENGYRNGFAQGQYDRRKGVRHANPRGHGAYRLGLDGWVQGADEWADYQRSFRVHFVEGYNDGYNGRAADTDFGT